MKDYEDDVGVHCYSDEEIMAKVLVAANEKVQAIFDDLEIIKNIEVHKSNILNVQSPQTALKIYKIENSRDENERTLVGILDVNIDELNNILHFCFYEISKSSNASAQFINGSFNFDDGIPTPMQQDEFDTRGIDSLIEEIYIILNL